MKVVFDVNIWISALLWGGTLVPLLRLAQKQQITIFASEDLLLELALTLQKKKLENRLQQRQKTAQELMVIVRALINLCPNLDLVVPDLRDQKDHKIVAAAVSSGSEFIITGDQDLLVLDRPYGIEILSPQDFLALLNEA